MKCPYSAPRSVSCVATMSSNAPVGGSIVHRHRAAPQAKTGVLRCTAGSWLRILCVGTALTACAGAIVRGVRVQVLLAVALLTLLSAAAQPAPAYRVLVFSRTAGFRHDLIPDAVQAVTTL